MPHVAMLQEHNIRTGFFEREQFEAVRDHLPAPFRPVIRSPFSRLAHDERVLPLEWRQVDRRPA